MPTWTWHAQWAVLLVGFGFAAAGAGVFLFLVSVGEDAKDCVRGWRKLGIVAFVAIFVASCSSAPTEREMELLDAWQANFQATLDVQFAALESALDELKAAVARDKAKMCAERKKDPHAYSFVRGWCESDEDL